MKKESAIPKTVPTTGANIVHAIYGGGKKKETVQQKWEELNDIYESCAQALVSTGESVNLLLRTPGVIERINNTSEVRTAVTGLKNDIERFTNDLIQIHNQHKDMKGVIKSEDDHIRSINIFEDYSMFSIQFKAVTMPTIMIISEYASEALDVMQKETKQLNEQQVVVPAQQTQETSQNV